VGLFDKWRVPRSPFFHRYPVADPEMILDINQRTVVDRQRGFIYFRSPKAANSTVMLNLAGGELRGKMRDLKRLYPRVSTLSRREVTSLASRFFLFAVARNPYSRIVSAYLDKVTRGRSAVKVRERIGLPADAEVSFLEFCRYLQAGGVNDNPHWYRQVDLVPCGPELLHFIGHVENLSADLEYILARVNGEKPLEQASWVPHRTGADGRLQEFYCPESIEIVRSLYCSDFDAFGYSPDFLHR
jgi:hypothetical protein